MPSDVKRQRLQADLQMYSTQYTALSQQHRTTLDAGQKVLLAAQLTALEQQITQTETELNRSDFQVILPHNFDLSHLVNECLDYLDDTDDSLLGFVVQNPSIPFLQNVCERLKYEWGRNKLSVKPIISIDARHTALDQALATIHRRYIPGTKTKPVLFPVQLNDPLLLQPFWAELQNFQAQIDSSLIILIGVSERVNCPQPLQPLPPPRFRPADIRRWVQKVLATETLLDDLADQWIDLMKAECSYNKQIQIEWVYDHIRDMNEFLQSKPTLDKLQAKLQERQATYAP